MRTMGIVSIDLHTHSTTTDGTDSTAELVTSAARNEVNVLALTDHDTTAGWSAAIAALPPGMMLVPGAELSCASRDAQGRMISVHLLAYLFDAASPVILAEQRRLRTERRYRL